MIQALQSCLEGALILSQEGSKGGINLFFKNIVNVLRKILGLGDKK